MGGIFNPAATSILLSSPDRLIAKNAAAGLPPTASHIIALGEAAADSIGATVSQLVAIGPGAGSGANTATHIIALGDGAAAGARLSDVIAIGAAALDSGSTDTAAFNGSIAVGPSALSALVNNGTSAVVDVPMVAVGRNAGALMQYASSSVLIGDNAFADHVGQTGAPFRTTVAIGAFVGQRVQNSGSGRTVSESVILGHQALSRGTLGLLGCASSVIIGYRAAQSIGPSGDASMSTSVIIGFQAAQNFDTTVGLGANVFIGSSNSTASTRVQNSVCIGQAAAITNTGLSVQDNNVVVGDSSVLGQITRFVGVGGGQSGSGCNRSVFMGAAIAAPSGNRTGLILIGDSCGNTSGTVNMRAASHLLLIETDDGITKRTAIFGELSNGNIVLGNSTEGTDRDCPGTNILKLIEGTKTGASPTGGGFFYVAAGALHWVGSAGTDTVLAPA